MKELESNNHGERCRVEQLASRRQRATFREAKSRAQDDGEKSSKESRDQRSDSGDLRPKSKAWADVWTGGETEAQG